MRSANIKNLIEIVEAILKKRKVVEKAIKVVIKIALTGQII